MGLNVQVSTLLDYLQGEEGGDKVWAFPASHHILWPLPCVVQYNMAHSTRTPLLVLQYIHTRTVHHVYYSDSTVLFYGTSGVW